MEKKMPEAIGQKEYKDVPLHLSRVSQDGADSKSWRCRAQSVGCLEINNPIDRAQDATQ
ncbi:hypothetical protein [Klebsiella pneumoniae IS53]|nr:hypothetical protein [Klebsiella pneumoniae IS53]